MLVKNSALKHILTQLINQPEFQTYGNVFDDHYLRTSGEQDIGNYPVNYEGFLEHYTTMSGLVLKRKIDFCPTHTYFGENAEINKNVKLNQEEMETIKHFDEDFGLTLIDESVVLVKLSFSKWKEYDPLEGRNRFESALRFAERLLPQYHDFKPIILNAHGDQHSRYPVRVHSDGVIISDCCDILLVCSYGNLVNLQRSLDEEYEMLKESDRNINAIIRRLQKSR